MQFLDWGGKDTPFGIKWKRDGGKARRVLVRRDLRLHHRRGPQALDGLPTESGAPTNPHTQGSSRLPSLDRHVAGPELVLDVHRPGMGRCAGRPRQQGPALLQPDARAHLSRGLQPRGQGGEIPRSAASSTRPRSRRASSTSRSAATCSRAKTLASRRASTAGAEGSESWFIGHLGAEGRPR